MNPNQPNPYDFLNGSNNQKRSPFGAGTSQKTRIIQVVIAVIVLLVISVITINLLTAGSKATTEKLVKLAAAQQDLVAVSELGSANAREPDNVSRSATTASIVRSQNIELTAYLAKNGVKNLEKQLAKYRDKTYEKTLDEAKKNGNYDEVYRAVFSNRLDLYRSNLQAAYASVEGPTIKKQLESNYTQLTLITPGEN